MNRIAVLASGRGSNFEAICDAFKDTALYPRLLVCDREHAPVLEKARQRGVKSFYIPLPVKNREEAAAGLSRCLQDEGIELVVLAGFMKVLPPNFVRAWRGRIVNIHPSILPRYPGTEAIRRAWEAGEDWFGITIHLVDEGVDTGPILFQNMAHRLVEDTLDTIEEKIHKMEHMFYPKVIQNFCETWRN